MVTIDIDFDVFKALTIRRATEEMTYNAVVRELLKLPTGVGEKSVSKSTSYKKAWTWKGTTLPHGTQLKAEYKGQAYTAEIVDGHWTQDGNEHSSPSAAGHAITGSGINGWWFWSAKRPGEVGWTALGTLRRGAGDQQASQ